MPEIYADVIEREYGKLEPHLGFLHSIQYGMPSLVCDFQELYRHLVDDFTIDFCKDVSTSDFVLKSEDYSANRKGQRQYLNEEKTNELINRLNRYFERKVQIPRIRRGERQEIETLIGEEALLFTKHLRNEKRIWTSRIVELS